MTDYQFYTLYGEALTSTDRDAYVSDWALSSIWEDGEDADIPATRIEQVGNIWDAAHLTIRQMRDHTGLTQAAFAQRFCIPKRTVENWEGNKSECPAYVRLMLAQLTGLYTRP